MSLSSCRDTVLASAQCLFIKKEKLQQSQWLSSAKTQLTKRQFCANTVLCHGIGVSYVSKTNYLTNKIIENITLEMDFLSDFFYKSI